MVSLTFGKKVGLVAATRFARCDFGFALTVPGHWRGPDRSGFLRVRRPERGWDDGGGGGGFVISEPRNRSAAQLRPPEGVDGAADLQRMVMAAGGWDSGVRQRKVRWNG